MKNTLMQAGLGLLLAFVVFALGTDVWARYQASLPPVVFTSFRVFTPVVQRGGELRYESKFEVFRRCPTEIISYLLAENGDISYRFDKFPGGYRPVGKQTSVITVKIPRETNSDVQQIWGDGKYLYRQAVLRYCQEGLFVDSSIPDLAFEIKGDAP